VFESLIGGGVSIGIGIVRMWGEGEAPLLSGGVNAPGLFRKSLANIPNGKSRVADQVGMNGIPERLVPAAGDSFLADHRPDDTAGRGGRAIIVQPHGNRFADDAGEISAPDREAPHGQAGVIDRVNGMHALELFINRIPRLLVIPDFRRNP